MFGWRKPPVPPVEENSEDSPYSMTEQDLIERQNEVKCDAFCHQFMAALIASLSAMSLGTAFGWSYSVTFKTFTGKGFADVTDTELALLASIVLLGCAFGSIAWYYVGIGRGPKKVLQTDAILFAACWFLTLIPNVAANIFTRFFLGFWGSVQAIAAETLLLESLEPNFSRYFLVLFNSSIMLGVGCTHYLGLFIDLMYLTIFCALIPLLQFLLLFIVPESPVFLFRYSESSSRKALIWYRGESNMYEALRNIRKDYDYFYVDPETYRYMMYTSAVIQALIRILVLALLHACSGYILFIFYNIRTWSETIVLSDEHKEAIIIPACLFISRLLWGLFHINIKPRIRIMLTSSCSCLSVLLALLGIYLGLIYHGVIKEEILFHNEDGYNSHWLLFLLVGGIIFSSDMGVGYYPRVLVIEYTPYQVFQKMQMFFFVADSLFEFFAVFFLGVLISVIPTYTIFLFNSVILCGGAFICKWYIVETIGKSLIEIQLKLGGNPVGNRGAVYTRMGRRQ